MQSRYYWLLPNNN